MLRTQISESEAFMKLTQFSDPDNFGKVERNIMTRFLEGFADCLPPEAAAMLTEPALLWRPYCQQWATHFKTPEKFGAPLIKALKEIEMLALPENEELFKEAMARVPEDWINRNLAALHQCVHLWLVVQAKSAPGLIFPSAEFGVRSAESAGPASLHIPHLAFRILRHSHSIVAGGLELTS